MDIGDIKNIMKKNLISGQKLVKSKKNYYNIQKTEEVEKDFTSSYYIIVFYIKTNTKKYSKNYDSISKKCNNIWNKKIS